MTRPGAVRIGISGWRYAPWRGAFYPEGLPQKDELRFASGIFGAIEINTTFYGLQRPPAFARWAEETPDGFVFAVKGPRYLTHVRRLADAAAPLANFLASGLLELGAKLGPILWQLPPSFRFDPARLDAFLALLPRDTEAARSLARRHEPRMAGRTSTGPGGKRPIRHAIEVRHAGFARPELVAMLRRHRVALVCADSVDWPRLMDLTADFVYCRLHGSEEIYASGYDDASLERWAGRVVAWARGGEPDDGERVTGRAGPKRARRDVFVFFDNDAKVCAPADAQALEARVRTRLEGGTAA